MLKFPRFLRSLAAQAALLAGFTLCLHAAPSLVYFGTATTGDDRGIYAADFDSQTGVLSPTRRVAVVSNPVFVAVHPNHQWLYSLGEVPGDDGKPVGIIEGFTIDPKTGALSERNQRLTGGLNPCHITVDSTGRSVLTTNYNGGFVAAYSLDADGLLAERTAFVQHAGSGPNPDRQTGPHTHSVNLDPTNRFAIVCDLGLDKVFVYRFDASTGALSANSPAFTSVKPGAGPRHFAFHPSGHFAYVVNEINSSVTAFAWDSEKGTLTETQTVAMLPPDFKSLNTAAEVVVHKSGRFLYASNRGYDSLNVFSIDPKTGRLSPIQVMRDSIKYPRNFSIDPSGKWLVCANRDSNTATVYAIDPKTGVLTFTGQAVSVPQAICVRFLAR